MKRFARFLSLLGLLVFAAPGLAADPPPQGQPPAAQPARTPAPTTPTQPQAPSQPRGNVPASSAATRQNATPGPVAVPPGAMPPPHRGRVANRRTDALARCNERQLTCTNRCNHRTMGQAGNLCYNQCNGQFIHCTARANALP